MRLLACLAVVAVTAYAGPALGLAVVAGCLTVYGYGQLGDRRWPNSWVPAGKTVRVVICQVCEDTGWIHDDDGNPVEPCDCRMGDAT